MIYIDENKKEMKIKDCMICETVCTCTIIIVVIKESRKFRLENAKEFKLREDSPKKFENWKYYQNFYEIKYGKELREKRKENCKLIFISDQNYLIPMKEEQE